jgi:hypothetical protein
VYVEMPALTKGFDRFKDFDKELQSMKFEQLVKMHSKVGNNIELCLRILQLFKYDHPNVYLLDSDIKEFP